MTVIKLFGIFIFLPFSLWWRKAGKQAGEWYRPMTQKYGSKIFRHGTPSPKFQK
jgi:hypothetical protein